MAVLTRIVVIFISIAVNTLVLAAVLWILSDKKNNPFKSRRKKESTKGHRRSRKHEPWYGIFLRLPNERGVGITMAKCAGLVVTIELLRLMLEPIIGLSSDSTALLIVWVGMFIFAWIGGVMYLFEWNVGQAIALAIAMWGLRLWVGVALAPLT
jgi:hypothetical protein